MSKTRNTVYHQKFPLQCNSISGGSPLTMTEKLRKYIQPTLRWRYPNQKNLVQWFSILTCCTCLAFFANTCLLQIRNVLFWLHQKNLFAALTQSVKKNWAKNYRNIRLGCLDDNTAELIRFDGLSFMVGLIIDAITLRYLDFQLVIILIYLNLAVNPNLLFSSGLKTIQLYLF